MHWTPLIGMVLRIAEQLRNEILRRTSP